VGLGLAEPAWPFDPFEVSSVVGGLIALALAGLVWSLRRRVPGLAVTAVVWVALLGPMLGIVPFGYELTADRFSFLASVALLPGLAWLALQAPSPRVVGVAALVLLPAAGAWSHVRCGDWLTSEAFWERNLALNPRSALAHSGLGDAALKRNQLREAETHYLRAIELLPPYEPTLLGLGFIDLQEGRLAAGVAKLERYRVTHPESRGAKRFLKQAYEQLGRPDLAEALDEPAAQRP
jgi:tetratricopeptide (TPR) repeat protein